MYRSYCLKLLYLIIIFISAVFLSTTYAEIVVYDTVAIKNEEAVIKIEIKEGLFKKGGELVEIFIDEKSIGKALSGIDGFAFKYHKPNRIGLFKIFVKSATKSSSANLLVLPKKSEVVLVEFEGGLLENNPFQYRTSVREGSQKVIRQINKKYPVIILQSGIMGKKFIREFLKKHGFIDLLVIPCKEGHCYEEFKQKGIVIKAIVGDIYITNFENKEKPIFFSFRKREGAIPVDDWEDIKNILFKKKLNL